MEYEKVSPNRSVCYEDDEVTDAVNILWKMESTDPFLETLS